MSELISLARGSRPFVHEGTEFRVAVMTPKDLGELQNWLRDHVPHPLEAVKPHLAGLPEAAQLRLLDRAYDDAKNWPPAVDDEAAWKYFLTEPGRTFYLFVVLRRATPNMTLERAEALSAKLDGYGFMRISALASGSDPDDPKGSSPEQATTTASA